MYKNVVAQFIGPVPSPLTGEGQGEGERTGVEPDEAASTREEVMSM